jgi:hypothetical protein
VSSLSRLSLVVTTKVGGTGSVRAGTGNAMTMSKGQRADANQGAFKGDCFDCDFIIYIFYLHALDKKQAAFYCFSR